MVKPNNLFDLVFLGLVLYLLYVIIGLIATGEILTIIGIILVVVFISAAYNVFRPTA